MKYIKLIDGRIVDVSLFDEYQTNNEKGESVFDGFGNGKVYFPAEDILKQANSIEELCDEFVVWEESQGDPVSMSMSEKEQFEKIKVVILLSMKAKMNCWLKLAIWTDKGLIFVAQMNEKGVLELLWKELPKMRKGNLKILKKISALTWLRCSRLWRVGYGANSRMGLSMSSVEVCVTMPLFGILTTAPFS